MDAKPFQVIAHHSIYVRRKSAMDKAAKHHVLPRSGQPRVLSQSTLPLRNYASVSVRFDVCHISCLVNEERCWSLQSLKRRVRVRLRLSPIRLPSQHGHTGGVVGKDNSLHEAAPAPPDIWADVTLSLCDKRGRAKVGCSAQPRCLGF